MFKSQPVEIPTLRDQMAMAAITGISVDDTNPNSELTAAYYAQRAYMIADAMMEARKKGGE